ncbi:hypothetical protein F4780DRAFT_539881 [Xylariomycetidae sp. FL0641]|nr:hypothetical protein F4780DRAFT_539881 [Xylariomycetidae sp. FL0641]
MPIQWFSSSYSSFSSSTSSNGGPPQQTVYAQRSFTDRSGTRTERMYKEPGQAPVYESSEQPSNRRVQGGGVSAQNRIEDVTDADKAYEERIQDEYAKREGGA